MQIRRLNDILAIKDCLSDDKGITAFHASNLEIANISSEAFDQMENITIFDDLAPTSINGNSTSEEFIELKEWDEYINPDVRSGKMDFGIRTITLNVNQICNLKCTYCAASGDGTYSDPSGQISLKQTLPQIEFFVNKCTSGETFAISFIGGEPLLHPAAIKAVHDYSLDLCNRRGVNLIMKIVTNGTLINESTIDLLRTLRVDLTISMDGTPEMNDLNRPAKDGSSPTKKILQGLDLLQESRGNIKNIHIASVVTKTNSNVYENYKYITNLKIDSFDFVFANDESDLATQKQFINDYKLVMADLWSKGGEKELRRLKGVNGLFLSLDNQQRTENYCGAGKNYLMVDAKNRLFTCVWDANYLSETVGHDDQIDMQKVDKLSKPLIDLNNCNTCWARFLCGGGCMHINRSHSGGDKHKKSKLFCERTRSLILGSLVYYKLSRA